MTEKSTGESTHPNHQSSPTSTRSTTFLAASSIAAVMVVILLAMGRQLWCSCGTMAPWSWQIYSEHNSQHLIDPYSFTHVLHGVVFFAVLWPLRNRSIRVGNQSLAVTAGFRLCIALTVEAAWEVLENTSMVIERYRATTISLDYYGDSVANSMSDLAACALGYWFASRVRWQASLILFVTVETALLITIRDSLVLNVIMLVWPIDAILHWQSG
ncbi:DUF2585 family protein [Stieleria sp. JC731]|uniref:DUF2585 family protein n=1 Tax=Pirellulaceae TaxID=2691357 RepID=UPI001E3E7A5B|nr:DUF2585 family protein [Stieleria sp. JC731]MCC9600811.1 DUF2585 family protein [Stieleria sp. JC731]